MPNYYDLVSSTEIAERGYPRFLKKVLSTTVKKRAFNKILKIKAHLASAGVPRKRDDNLLVCNWNLKEFGQSRKHPEFFYYIAEIINAFDLVVIQEVRRSINELTILMNILGDHWAYIINDVTEGNDGNTERSVLIYNLRRVDFNGFSGELVVSNGEQIKRTPQITGFIAAWKHFSIINVHLEPGNTDASAAHRRGELQRIMETLQPKLSTGGLGYGNIIISGDFNFYPEKDDAAVALLGEHGFQQVENLKRADTTLAQNKYTYDRLFIRRDKYFELIRDSNGDESCGVVEFKSLFQDDLTTYKSIAESDYHERNPTKQLSASYYPTYFWVHWLSRQMSDHYPIWIEINTDSSLTYLQEKLAAL